MNIKDIDKLVNRQIKESIEKILSASSVEENLASIGLLIEFLLNFTRLAGLENLGWSLYYPIDEYMEVKDKKIINIKEIDSAEQSKIVYLKNYLANALIQLIIIIESVSNLKKNREETEGEWVERLLQTNPEYLQKILEVGQKMNKIKN